MPQLLQVTTTLPDKDKALAIARALVEHRVAACVQVSGPVESVYWWKGMVESASEWVCTAKTHEDLLPRVEQEIRRLHPYELPEIIATPIVGGGRDYLQWLVDELAGEA